MKKGKPKRTRVVPLHESEHPHERKMFRTLLKRKLKGKARERKLEAFFDYLAH